jgi:Enoyl-(Acyl carrier protein) reductase
MMAAGGGSIITMISSTGLDPELGYDAYGMLSRTSLGRVGRSRECIGAALYLASEESSFTSGQCIGVDGGRF